MKATLRSLISALALAGLLSPIVLTGCLEGGGSSSASAPVNQGAQAARAGLDVTVLFPPAGATAAFIDENTVKVRVKVWDSDAHQCQSYDGEEYCGFPPENPTKTLVLDRPATGGPVTGRITNLALGEAMIVAEQLDAEGKVLEQVNVSAHLVEGSNTATVTMVRAQWDLQTPVSFNKLVSGDTARIDAFALLPWIYEYGSGSSKATARAATSYFMQPGMSFYHGVALGNNLCREEQNAGGTTITCGQNRLVGGVVFYYNRQDNRLNGPRQALLSVLVDAPLAPDNERERGWLLWSLTAEEAMEGEVPRFSDEDILQDLRVAVTAGDTIQGNLFEFRVNSVTRSNRVCYRWEDNSLRKVTITCPTQGARARARDQDFAQALGRALGEATVQAGKRAANAQGCYMDLRISYREEGEWGGWVPGSGGSPGYYWYYDEDVTEHVDACRHPFVAKARQLPSALLNLTIQ